MSTGQVGAGEAALNEKIAAMFAAKLKKDHPSAGQSSGETMPRDAHPKSHGCVTATFTVEDNLPPQLRVGLFANAQTFQAYIRYSNGAPGNAPDSRPDVRGVAIKLLGVPGAKILADQSSATTQDLILCNHPVFFVKNVDDYMVFSEAMIAGKPLAFFFPRLNPCTWHLREMYLMARALLKSIPSPTEIRYWSQTPYSFGEKAAKYSLIPRVIPAIASAPKSSKTPNYLRQALVEQLKCGDVVLDFMVQLQSDDVHMPVEDPRVNWSESRSPMCKVATIRIPAQTFDTSERDLLGENLSFTPWHSLPEHAPLGGINRCRKIVYQTISLLRHAANGVSRVEP